ncbi:MAG: helix-hairpin-helix domain-containing protein, partial [Pseudomonadales bacterium]|nr:helix-hairpin-helix domain-containing protein [Pseudomonadales bacterium]
LTAKQKEVLETLNLDNPLSEVQFESLLKSENDYTNEDPSVLERLLKMANALYRAGAPAIDDVKYDHIRSVLEQLQPENTYLHEVEPEAVPEAKTVQLPARMLSTDKAYSKAEIEKWIERLQKARSGDDSDTATELEIRVTPKLDGYAAFDDGARLYTRGDGYRGQDVTRAFNRGLQVAEGGERGLGPGEIVIKKSYFDEYLSEFFENSRNIQAAIIAEKKVDERIQLALDAGAVVFFPFQLLPDWKGDHKTLLADFEKIAESIWEAVDFDVDGVILEATDEAIKDRLGATRHHHRWQIAYKANVEKAEVRVLGVTPQTSRTGRVSPVAELEPTKLSGATISRATLHHYGMVKAKGVGPGALVQLVRSGLVIPKIEDVLQPVDPQLPEHCPSCDSSLDWEGDHLVCSNRALCPAQSENTMIHFFKTLGNIDGFGPATITRLYASGIRKVHEIYQLQQEDFENMGFGEKTSQNLITQLNASRSIAIEDWRFLSAFGVVRLGPGSSERLLEHHPIDTLFQLDAEDLVQIDGFAQVTAAAITENLHKIEAEFREIYALDFNLQKTKRVSEKVDMNTPIAGKQLVFTGTMVTGSRGDMEKQAKQLGAKVGKSVSKNTDYLVTGDKVGAKKISDAVAKGVRVISEEDYRSLLES